MVTTRLWWVRHGPTHQTAFTGWRDIPADLSDRAAVARLDAHLPTGARLISSDLIRAVATADAVAAGRTRLAHDPDLREFDFGAWDGLHWDAVAERDPALSRAFWEAPGDIAPPGGESWNAVAARTGAAIDRLVAAHPGQDIVAVAHFGTILTHLSHAGGLAPSAALSHRIDNLSVTRLDHRAGGGWQIETINHVP